MKHGLTLIRLCAALGCAEDELPPPRMPAPPAVWDEPTSQEPRDLVEHMTRTRDERDVDGTRASPTTPPAPPTAPPLPAAAVNTKDLMWADMPGVDGGRTAIVSGDPQKGPFALLFEAKKAIRFPMHVHSHESWTYVIKGEMTIVESGNTLVATAGGANYHSGRIPHTVEAKAGTTMFLVSAGPFDFTMVDARGNPLPPPAAPVK